MTSGALIMEAYVTLTTNEDYSRGAVVLGQSLKNSGTTKRLVILVGRGVTPAARDDLATVWDELVDVDIFSSTNPDNLALFNRPELAVTLTKLHAWKLTGYKKCVFLDADTLVVQNIDDLFSRPELSAAPDVGWPDCFNSGVFVFAPSLKTFDELLVLLGKKGSFDGGDQGLLNLYWSDWSTSDPQHRLPFSYNQTVSPIYTYLAAYKQFGHYAHVLHFLGKLKPWHHAYSSEYQQLYLHADSGPDQRSSVEQLKRWWGVYCQWSDEVCKDASLPHPLAPAPSRYSPSGSSSSSSPEPGALPAAAKAASPSPLANSPEPPPPDLTQEQVSELNSRRRWEQGRPDVYGEDNYSRIQAHLQSILSNPPDSDNSSSETV